MKYVGVNLGETRTIEQLWEQHFADPSQWWDNRVDKVSPGPPVTKVDVRLGLTSEDKIMGAL